MRFVYFCLLPFLAQIGVSLLLCSRKTLQRIENYKIKTSKTHELKNSKNKQLVSLSTRPLINSKIHETNHSLVGNRIATCCLPQSTKPL